MADNTPQATIASAEMQGIQNALQMSNQLMGRLIAALEFQFPAQAPYDSSLSITYSTAGGTTVAIGPGKGGAAIAYLHTVCVTTPTTAGSSISGIIYDAASPATAGSTNIMALIPSSGVQVYNTPFVNGLTIQPSSISSQRVSVYFINQVPSGG